MGFKNISSQENSRVSALQYEPPCAFEEYWGFQCDEHGLIKGCGTGSQDLVT